MFVQLTEIVNPAMNRGLFPNLAGGEVGLDFGFKVRNFSLVVVDGMAYFNYMDRVLISLLRHMWES
jgi:hypothetical protein